MKVPISDIKIELYINIFIMSVMVDLSLVQTKLAKILCLIASLFEQEMIMKEERNEMKSKLKS